MSGVQPPPLRALDDFLLGSTRFSFPDFQNLDRWVNRIIHNLLYYQTNYLLGSLLVLLSVGFWQPLQLLVGAAGVTLLLLAFIWAAEEQSPICHFCRNYPSTYLLTILSFCYLFLWLVGSVAVFLLGITLPILMVLVHASLRLRSLKNKMENHLENIGLKRTPMGLLLEVLGQEQEEETSSQRGEGEAGGGRVPERRRSRLGS